MIKKCERCGELTYKLIACEECELMCCENCIFDVRKEYLDETGGFVCRDCCKNIYGD